MANELRNVLVAALAQAQAGDTDALAGLLHQAKTLDTGSNVNAKNLEKLALSSSRDPQLVLKNALSKLDSEQGKTPEGPAPAA